VKNNSLLWTKKYYSKLLHTEKKGRKEKMWRTWKLKNRGGRKEQGRDAFPVLHYLSWEKFYDTITFKS
jgi:hypothetical protein